MQQKLEKERNYNEWNKGHTHAHTTIEYDLPILKWKKLKCKSRNMYKIPIFFNMNYWLRFLIEMMNLKFFDHLAFQNSKFFIFLLSNGSNHNVKGIIIRNLVPNFVSFHAKIMILGSFHFQCTKTCEFYTIFMPFFSPLNC